MKTGIELIAEERQNQIDHLRFTAYHDDSLNQDGQLALVASYYAMTEEDRVSLLGKEDSIYAPPTYFPWDRRWWRPTPDDRIRELTKAGALIAAEIDRLQRIKNANK